MFDAAPTAAPTAAVAKEELFFQVLDRAVRNRRALIPFDALANLLGFKNAPAVYALLKQQGPARGFRLDPHDTRCVLSDQGLRTAPQLMPGQPGYNNAIEWWRARIREARALLEAAE